MVREHQRTRGFSEEGQAAGQDLAVRREDDAAKQYNMPIMPRLQDAPESSIALLAKLAE